VGRQTRQAARVQKERTRSCGLGEREEQSNRAEAGIDSTAAYWTESPTPPPVSRAHAWKVRSTTEQSLAGFPTALLSVFCSLSSAVTSLFPEQSTAKLDNFKRGLPVPIGMCATQCPKDGGREAVRFVHYTS